MDNNYPVPPFANCICNNLILEVELSSTTKSICIGKEGCHLIQITQQSQTKYIYWKDELNGFEIWGETQENINNAKKMLFNWITFVILCYKRDNQNNSMEIDTNPSQIETSTTDEVKWAISYLQSEQHVYKYTLDLSKENIIKDKKIPPLVRPPQFLLNLIDKKLGKKSYKLKKSYSILYEISNPNRDIILIKRFKNSFNIYSSNEYIISNAKVYILELIYHTIQNYVPSSENTKLPSRCLQWVRVCEQSKPTNLSTI
tara:strand:- start:326 stop:1099 length:774 start_codon:yes stop_codon:yes gene_type:complete